MNASLDLLRTQLRHHPATPPGTPLSLTVELRTQGDGLRLRYTLSGHTAALCIPAPAAPTPTDGLWRHTCFEAFVAATGEAAYREFNFSPSSQWAAYRFSAERERDTAAEAREPVLPMPPPAAQATPRALTLTARLPLNALPRSASVLDIGLCAVIEERDGRLSYWALHHPGARPDFHHPDGRTLRLASPLI
ncbi:DOMON-like domain-containing protein [Hydrogenophaga sp. BPS33]|uniref:DOMON-like domain-containing protein n=1 Tax=Hydrogenophaga sp. BPS33 TaxID=2651974 RepID=UPI00131F9F79|nr:DOMON-like domain-containing protein [Hydrogenophaga sp. BPS33]QHE86378.1 DOMON-like domain-containing protein [Hydrogenophaga sp. BPS33]